MRVTVGTIVGLLAAGRTHEEILRAYPYLAPDDIRAALSYAAWRTEAVEIPLFHEASPRHEPVAYLGQVPGGERLTHDLDFSAILASTEAAGPSVLQVRTLDVLPDAIGPVVVRVLRDHSEALAQGAIVSIDELASRVRVLPIRGR
jgi:Protein of unknown function (DUF433)